MAATGHAKWMGNVEAGSGTVETGTKSLEGTYTAASRFADGEGTNPEEMLAAAHASCFSMALSLILGQAGHAPESVETDASVYLRRTDDGFEIHKIELETVGNVPGIDEDEFKRHAETAKRGCPVSRALASVPDVSLEARLAG
ncbi:MAG TPA: OsmC family peroxiredoxin [Solirubrobacterales bacterium]|jgi:osmotically inducible protein OsmC|nr:OsmC family peroxiredoxin [Solirubrobacterales bacterium]